MTNHWIDIRNSDVILITGSNAAENHPISFKWVMEAVAKGAKLISVDPRFTRTSARAHTYAPIRSGSDIAFLNGMMNYIFANKRYDEFYIQNYTNAPFLVNGKFKMPGELDGLFSGYDESKRKYNKSTWSFQTDASGVIKKDMTFSDKSSVFQLLKKHVSRYTPDMVSSITGMPKDKMIEIYDAYTATSEVGKSATIMYAMGWTQHTVGTQNIRAMAMIQLMLGNIGVAGGGVNALRGESNVQGSTDHCLLWHILPGYLKTPRASNTSLTAYNKKWTPTTKEPQSANWWGNYPKYSVSLLKAHYGANATKANDFGYDWLPKVDDGVNYSWLMIFDEMMKGNFKGFFAWGQNPACSGANANKNRKAMGKLDWLVNVNLFDNETGSFWRGPGMKPEDIMTEVFELPCATSVEKEGSITNSGRWAQWRYKAVDAPGQAKSDSWIMNALHNRVKQLYVAEGGAFPDPVTKLSWDYGMKAPDGYIHDELDIHEVAKEINGRFTEDTEVKGKKFKKGDLVPTFGWLQADGTTSSGNWLYCQSYNASGNNMARRGKADPSGVGLYPNWSWAWPVNRRIVYNRASVDENGKPRAPHKPVIWYTGGKWKGDVPDGGWPPLSNKAKTKKAFIMKPHGVASIFGPGRADGPFPEHYEPLECPIEGNPLHGTRINPAAKIFDDEFASNDERFPYVASTYRLGEHWQTGVMTRHQPWALEMQPQNFCELSKELARELGIRNGEKLKISSARGEVFGIAIVTERFKPFKITDKTVHQVGLPWCFGWQYPEDGSGFDSSNLLTPNIGDANTMIPETKAFMVNVQKA